MGKVKEYYTDEDMLEALGVIRHKKNIYTIMQDIFKEYEVTSMENNSHYETHRCRNGAISDLMKTLDSYGYKYGVDFTWYPNFWNSYVFAWTENKGIFITVIEEGWKENVKA